MKFKTTILLLICIVWSPLTQARNVTVGIINLKPWGEITQGRKFKGQHIDFFNELSKRVGLTFDYKMLSIPRIKEGLRNGDIDITIIFHRQKMIPYVHFIGLVLPYNYYLIGNAGHSFDDQEIQKLERVGYVQGEEDVAKKCLSDKFNASTELLPASNYRSLLKMLQKQRFDAVTIPSKGLKAYLDEIDADERTISQLFVLCKNEAYLQTSKKSNILKPDDIALLRKTLNAMIQDGTVERIAAKYHELEH
jgi:ABC-type amino acid transport substrate-binding protein